MTERHQPDRLGELVGGKYRLVRFLAEGGMGVVYEAQHAVVKRRFAVKFLHADLAKRREILARFQREAEAAGALESENVAAAIDFGIVDDGTPYIVMEYLVGESLASLLERDGRLPVQRATDLVLQACRGIQAAHASGIIHRDLKPHNLFVCRRQDGTDLVKVLDFGIAKLQAIDEKSIATRTGAILGTVVYMSPEQARGDKAVDHRADVYALGAILYELLSGRKPHPGDSHHAVLHHISTQPAVPLDSVVQDLPLPLVEIVGRSLLPDLVARFDSAEALGSALAPFARREVWPEPRESVPVRPSGDISSTALSPTNAAGSAPVAAGSLAVSSVDKPQEPRARRRRRMSVVIAIGAVAVALPFAIALALMGRRHGEDDSLHLSSDKVSPATLEKQAASSSMEVSAPISVSRSAADQPTAPVTSAPGSPLVLADSPAPASSRSATGGRPSGRPSRRPAEAPLGGTAPSASASTRPVSETRSVPFQFDPHNPYN